MASKRRVRRKSCQGKARHANEENAWKAVRATQDVVHTIGLEPYKCAFCGWWHIGHNRGKVLSDRCGHSQKAAASGQLHGGRG